MKRLLRFLTAACLLLCGVATMRAWDVPKELPLASEDMEKVRREAAKVIPGKPAGVWSFPDEDLEVAIIPYSESAPDVYALVLLYDADISVPPTTVIGFLSPSASRAKWHAWLYTESDDHRIYSPKEFVATFSNSAQSDEASLVFERPKGGVKWHINPLAMLPFLRRLISISVSKKDSELPYGLYRKDTTRDLRWL